LQVRIRLTGARDAAMSILTYALEDNFILSELRGHITPDELDDHLLELNAVLDEAPAPQNVVIDLSAAQAPGDFDLADLSARLLGHRKVLRAVLIPVQQAQAVLEPAALPVAATREAGLDLLGYWS